MTRRFAPPWSVEEQHACFVVRDTLGPIAALGEGQKSERHRQRGVQRVSDPSAKLSLLDMAQSWLKLAEQAAKNRETVLACETPMP